MRAKHWLILVLCVAGAAAMTIERGSVVKTLGLTNTIGNLGVDQLGSIWEPWPQDALWDILESGYWAESTQRHRFYTGHPQPPAGSLTSTIKYSSVDLLRFNLTDRSVYWKMLPAQPDDGAGTNLYQTFGFFDTEDGDNYAWALAEIERGDEPELTLLTNVEQPYTDPAVDGDNLIDAAWDPTGTYLAVCGYNDDFDQFFAWYKLDGGTLTKLSAPDPDPQAAFGVAWDSTGTYLAVGANYNWGDDEGVFLYKRDGDSLTLVDSRMDGVEDAFGAGRVIWLDDYLIVGNHNYFWQPWNNGNDGIGVYQRDGDDLSFVGSVTVELDVYSFDLSPDGDYLLVACVDFADHKARAKVYEWDGEGGLMLVDETDVSNSFNWGAAWHESGEYFASGAQNDALGWGAELWAWDVSTETITAKSQVSSGKPDRTGNKVVWLGDYLFVVGADRYSGTDDPQVIVLRLDGDEFGWVTESDPDDTTYYRYASALHPDGTYLAVGSERYNDGDILTVWTLSGFDNGDGDLVIRLSAGYRLSPYGSGDDERAKWEAPYNDSLHRWVRLSHDSDADTIYWETASKGCESWVERLAFAVDPGVDLGKLALEAEAWLVTAASDSDLPAYGYFGPLNPEATEHPTLRLINTIMPVPIPGLVEKTLRLRNEIEEL